MSLNRYCETDLQKQFPCTIMYTTPECLNEPQEVYCRNLIDEIALTKCTKPLYEYPFMQKGM